MSLRLPDLSRTFGGLTGFWRSLLCFQEAGPRRARPTTEVSGRADVEATRTRFEAANDLEIRVLVSTGSTVPVHVRTWFSGMRGD